MTLAGATMIPLTFAPWLATWIFRFAHRDRRAAGRDRRSLPAVDGHSVGQRSDRLAGERRMLRKETAIDHPDIHAFAGQAQNARTGTPMKSCSQPLDRASANAQGDSDSESSAGTSVRIPHFEHRFQRVVRDTAKIPQKRKAPALFADGTGNSLAASVPSRRTLAPGG
ncbi:hypothetical protein P4123_03450 [Pseudomonas aeruginosa]|nr:hypothetical protein [Pseudomonas aeruginosa]